MAPDDAPFLKAIRAAPDDDLPRLIYADRLDDRGDPRGEFIRLQIAGGDRVRAVELEAAHCADWLGPCVETFSRWRFVRGLLEPFLDPTAYLDIAAKLERTTAFAAVHLQPTTPVHPETVAALCAAPAAEYARSLLLGYEWLRDDGVRAACASPHLVRVVNLHLQTSGLTDAAAFALAETPHLPALRYLYLENNLIGDAGVAALATSPHRAGLEVLDLSHNALTPAGARALAESSYLDRLQSLRLFGHRIDGRSAAGRALRKRFGDAVRWR